jgi:2-hydroxycyclohexanecarboxyl-CoA dehydrogenase
MSFTEGCFMGLQGMNAVVTGGAQGIGRAIALRLARDGANIGILDIQKETAEKTADEIGRLGVKAIAIQCDATDYQQVKESVARIHKEYGSIDILINNAGIDMAGPFVDTDPSQWDKILNVNYRSFLIASHVCIPYMIENKRGNIVSMGSDAGRIGAAGEVLYCGTKAAIMASSKALARELARYNIRVNAVSPGPVHTDLWDQLHPGEKGQKVTEAVMKVIPMRRLGTPEDVADVVAFFVSEDARYLTGQVLSIDGGLTMIG